MIEHTNMYLGMTREAYSTVPVREVTNELGEVTGSLTLADIFPNALKFYKEDDNATVVLDHVLCGVEYTGRDVPDLMAVASTMGFTVDWGIDTVADVIILGITEAKEYKARLQAIVNPTVVEPVI